MTERLAAEQRVPVRAAPPPPAPATPGGGVGGGGDGRSAEFVRSVSMPGGGNRRPVLELVERHGTAGEEAPPARPARASGRHGRHGRRAVQQQRSADQLPQKRAPPPRPPPPNLQAALGSPPSYEETLKMDSAAKNRLSAPISSSGNPFLMGVRRSSSPSPAVPSAAPTTQLHRDLSSPALTPGGGAGNSTGAPVSRTSSTKSSAADSASRRSSATPSLDSLSARSGPAADGPAVEGPSADSASSDGGGAVLGRSDSSSSRSSYNPFLPLPVGGGGGGGEGGTIPGGASPSVSAPPRRPGPPVHGSQPSDARLGQTPPSAAWVGSALSAVSRDADWAGRVSRAQAEQRGSPFSRDGPGRTAHHGSTVHHGAPFGRETAWAGRVNRDSAAPAHGHGMVTSASSGSLSKEGEAASGVPLSASSGFLSQPTEPSSSSAPGVGSTAVTAGAPTGVSASPSVSVSTSPTNSLPASAPASPPPSPPPSPPTSPPPDPPTSPPPDPPTSPPLSPAVNLPDPPSSPPARHHHPTSPGVSFPTTHPLASSARSATTSPPTSPPTHSPSHLVLTVHTTVSHDSDDSASRPGCAESVQSPSSAGHQSVHSPSPSVGHRSSVGSARSSTTSLERTGHSITSLDRAGRSTASLERADRSSPSASLHNGSVTSMEHAPHGSGAHGARRSLPAEAVMRRERGTSAPREEAEQGAHRRSADAPPLNWGLPVEPVTADTPQAVALYDFHSSAPGDLTFKAGDALVLLRRVTADWLLCRLGSRHGLVPAHHVRETVPLPGAIPSAALPGAAALPAALPAPSPSSVQPASPSGSATSHDGPVTSPDGQPGAPGGREGQRVMALYDFVPQEKYDLGFKAGDMLVVVGKLNDDWGYGSRRGLTGQFPLAYVDVAVETVPTI